MNTGAYISGAAHAGLIGFLLFGGLLERNRLPEISVADVSVITSEEFAALTQPQAGPEIVTDAAVPEAPDEGTAPGVAAPEEVAPPTPNVSQPDVPEPSEAPVAALEAPAPVPLPEAEVSDEITPAEAPPEPDDRPEAPEEAPPSPATRVAPEPAAPPPPDVETAPEVVEDTAPAPSPEPPAPEEAPAAPEEATTEIVTEAEETESLAPASSPRPKARPARPTATAAAEPEAEPEPEPAPTPEPQVNDAVADALSQALGGGGGDPAPAPSGPPLTGGERDTFRVAVQDCWVVDVGSQAANVTVTVGVRMTREGTVEGGEVRQISASGGDDAAQRTAFEAARRAVLRCQRGGYPLPADKYDHWQEIEMTFNPEGMRLK